MQDQWEESYKTLLMNINEKLINGETDQVFGWKN